MDKYYIMDIGDLNKLNNENFKGLVGIDRSLFFSLVKEYDAQLPRTNRPRILPPIYEILIAFIYLRQYHTIRALAVTYKVSKSTIAKAIERVEIFLKKAENIQLPGISSDLDTIVCVDCTEILVERPTEAQAESYSGKKKPIPPKCK